MTCLLREMFAHGLHGPDSVGASAAMRTFDACFACVTTLQFNVYCVGHSCLYIGKRKSACNCMLVLVSPHVCLFFMCLDLGKRKTTCNRVAVRVFSRRLLFSLHSLLIPINAKTALLHAGKYFITTIIIWSGVKSA